MRIVLFGTGQYCKNRISCFAGDEIVAFLDNKAKEGELFLNIPVYLPYKVSELQYDAICLMAGAEYAKKMCTQLIELGVDSNLLYENDRAYFKEKKNKEITIISKGSILENKIVVFLPNLANTGGIRAAMYAMCVLNERYGNLTVVSPCEGSIKSELLNKGYDIIIASDISENNSLLWKLINQSKMIMLNGLYYGYLVQRIEELTDASVLWWLHSGDSSYKTYPIQNGNMDTGRVIVAGVSELVCAGYRRHNFNRRIDVLPFGIPDEYSYRGVRIKPSTNIVFAIIGTITKVKGIDILLDAVGRLERESLSNAEFWIIGAEVNKKYADELHEKYDNLKCVKWMGEKTHAEVMELYNSIDVLISSSIEDMLPIVTIEAMMHGKPCIVSDAVGTADFLKDGREGLIFPSKNTEKLAESIKKIIDNPESIKRMGQKGRELFEKNFSEEVFKKRFVEYWENRNEDISSL